MDTDKLIPPPPDEQQIGNILKNLHPEPGTGFYSRMAKAPWHDSRRILFSRLGLAVIILALMIWASWPGLVALARQVTIFFLPKNSDALTISLSTPAAGDLLILQPKFELTQSEAEIQAGFILLKINEPSVKFQGAAYDATLGSVMQFYEGAGYNLYLVQRLHSNGPSYFSIGASATVHSLTVRSVPGEYVSGGWKGISEDDPAATPDLLQATWDSSQFQYTLRWSEDVYIYELRCHGKMCPPQAELVDLANRMR